MSTKRRALLDEDPDLLHELLEARLTETVPGLLDLEKSWHALDVLLSNEGDDALVGDAVLGRKAMSFGPRLTFGRGKLIEPERVAEIAQALDALDADMVTKRYERLRGREVHGGYGPKDAGATEYDDLIGDLPDPEADEERRELTDRFESLRELYRTAAQRGHAMFAVVT